MKNLEFEVKTASFMPLNIDIDILDDKEATCEIEGGIQIPEASTFFSTIQSPFGDLHIAFFAEAITIFGILALTISSEFRYNISPSLVSLHSGCKEELSMTLKGKMLKVYYPSDSVFGKGRGSSMIDSFFSRGRETKCAVFRGWEREFVSLDDVIEFLSGYMLIA